MELLTRKLKALKEVGVTEAYINDLIGSVNHERRLAGVEFKADLLDNINNSPEFKTFQVMDQTSIVKVLEKTKREWLNK